MRSRTKLSKGTGYRRRPATMHALPSSKAITKWCGLSRPSSQVSRLLGAEREISRLAHPLAPEGAEFRGTATVDDVTTPLPSLRSEVGTGGSGLGRPAQPGPPAANRQADHRPRSSGARWPPAAR